MASLQGSIKWSHEVLRYFLINMDIGLSERNYVVCIRSIVFWHFFSELISISFLSWKFTTFRMKYIYHLLYHVVESYYTLFSHKKHLFCLKILMKQIAIVFFFTVGMS